MFRRYAFIPRFIQNPPPGVVAIVSGTELQEILSICERVSGNNRIVGLCLYGSRECGYYREDSDYDVLMILEDYQGGVRYQYEQFGTVYLALLKVDRELFELDVARGVLGGFVAGRLLAPYLPLIGDRYLVIWRFCRRRRLLRKN